MSTDKADTTRSTTGASPASFPNPIDPDTLKAWAETPAQSCREALSFAAGRLRAQADFLQALAGCETPVDVWKHQAAYFQSLMSEYSQESAKAFKAMQESITGAGSRK